MPIEFQMPKLGLTMEAGTILEWLVADGTEVVEGLPVLLIETDKVESELESSGSGRLHQTGVVGESYPCGAVIGWFLAPNEAAPEASSATQDVAAGTSVTHATTVHGGDPGATAGDRIPVSPNARRLAGKLGVDLAGVSGTGRGGRIVSEDIEAAASASPPETRSSPLETETDDDVTGVIPNTQSLTDLLQTPSSVIPMRGMRRTIANRMHASLQDMAQLTLTMEVVMDAVVSDRERRKDSGPPPGYTDYVIAAVATALVRHPVVNSQVTADGVALLPEVKVGMAVALDDGLIVPVLHDAALLGLSELAAETTRLAEAARDSSLRLVDLEGGTFSVTALGMFGVDGFTPVVNPPNTAILGIGRLRDSVFWSELGEPVRSSVLTLSLTWDHRAFDGAPAARFAAEVRDLLEAGDFPD
jgi:pyruvate dehydrogenase E2 component (dihydrolipoamide acetyltransferase)